MYLSKNLCISCVHQAQLQKKFTPYVTDGRLFITDVSAKVKVTLHKNSSEDEIANVNVLQRHRTCRGQGLRH